MAIVNLTNRCDCSEWLCSEVESLADKLLNQEQHYKNCTFCCIARASSLLTIDSVECPNKNSIFIVVAKTLLGPDSTAARPQPAMRY
jgi:hypothetical protein